MGSPQQMRRAILLTAYNRPNYLRSVLDSWKTVRGLESWDFCISIDRSDSMDAVLKVATEFSDSTGAVTSLRVTHENLGVLKHPYLALNDLFKTYDFVIRTEDDLEVSDDVLEYFDWTSRSFQNVDDVKSVHAFSAAKACRPSVMNVRKEFNPWVFGTWKHDWPDLKANWDLDYSTYNNVPGHESGFDWNFTTRVYPAKSWFGVFPEKSKVLNIGEYGVHGTPENLPASPTYEKSPESLGGRFDLQV